MSQATLPAPSLPTQAAGSPDNPNVSPVEAAPGLGTAAAYKLKVIHLCTVLLPLIGLGVAIFLLWGIAFDWVHLAIMGSMIIVTGLGITVGYHRLCTHKSFRSPAPVRYLLAAAGSMAVQGPVIEWCAEHRAASPALGSRG